MKTLQEYRKALSRYARSQLLTGASVVLATVSGLLAVMIFYQRISMTLAILTPPGILLFGLLLVSWVHRIDLKRLSLRCPHCGSGLVGSSKEQVVLASRNCPNCGKPVLASSAE